MERIRISLPLFSKIGIFEQNNNVSVNILAIRGGKEKLYILRKAKFNNQIKRRTTNFILIVEDEKRHYIAIKNLSQLLASSNSEHQHKHYFCLNCLQGFQSEETKDKHFEYCVDHEAVRIDMLEENSFMRFHSGQYQFKVPFIIYADFEVILQSLEEGTDPNPLSSYKK